MANYKKYYSNKVLQTWPCGRTQSFSFFLSFSPVGVIVLLFGFVFILYLRPNKVLEQTPLLR